MQILITGGTGFIGSRLVRRLLRDGHRISVLSRQDAREVRRQLSTEVRPIASVSAVNPSVAYDAIINLAGEGIMDKRWSRERKRQLLDSRVGLTTELIDLIERMENRPKRLISGSAVGIYGSFDTLQEQTGGQDETAPHGKGFPAKLCFRWEQTALRAEQLGVRVCIVRTGVVLHPGGGALSQMMPAFSFGLGGALGQGRQMLSWIHMDDMIEALVHLLNHEEAEGFYNATAPLPVTNREFSLELAAVLGRPSFFTMPAPLLKMILGESSEMILKGQAAIPTRLQREGFSFQYPDLRSALDNLLK
ncbi:MAG: TIGR01777 family oxidoreductase [Endozoicomonas sp.]